MTRHIILLIPARAGSKGLPGKNTMDFMGKPMIAHTIEAALGADLGRVIVSTDSEHIAECARQAGAQVPFMRPAELASDTATTQDVIRHAGATLYPNISARGEVIVMLLQPTSPLRTTQDILASWALFERSGRDVISVVRAAKPSSWYLHLDEEGATSPLLGDDAVASRRQAQRPDYIPNGAIYIRDYMDWIDPGATTMLSGSLAYEMPPDRSVDIDTAADLHMALYYADTTLKEQSPAT